MAAGEAGQACKDRELNMEASDYLALELRQLDIRLKHLVSLQGAADAADPLEQFRGLVLTEAEILELLDEDSAGPWSDSGREALAQALSKSEEEITGKREACMAKGIALPLPRLAEAFGLKRLEEQCIIIALVAELDRKYEKLFAYVQDDINMKHPTVDLAIRLLAWNGRDKAELRRALSKESRLFRYFFKEQRENAGSWLSQPLKLDERITDYILDIGKSLFYANEYAHILYPDERLQPLLLHRDIQDRLRSFAALRNNQEGMPESGGIIFYLQGRKGSGKKLQAKHFCGYFKRPLLLVDMAEMPKEDSRFKEQLETVCREAILLRAIVCLDHFEALIEDEKAYGYKGRHLIEAVMAFSAEMFILSEKAWKPAHILNEYMLINIEFEVPRDFERKRIWELFAKQYEWDSETDWGSLAGKFSFTAGEIESALKTAGNYESWGKAGNGGMEPETLYKACYAQIRHELEKKASLIKSQYTWEDIVLPEEQVILLKNACNHIKYRHVVYGDWGFDRKLSYGKGLSMLFSGPPGTGKTMAAQVIARELYLELYKIDLSQVVSKYIGETEKNLQEIFREAQLSNAILFFDETDALFGKRTEVKDSHDKYANIETSFLLQKMEEYEGITVLATNFLNNIDEAFIRRISFIVKFPFPDRVQRERIWRSIYPVETPLCKDLDFEFLAGKFEFAGGNIKNIAVAAAFLAAASGEPVGMRHIIGAARTELQKTGKLLLKEELGEYSHLSGI